MSKPDDIASIREMLEAINRKLDAVIMEPRKEWMTVADYADHCKVTTRTVRNWIASGRLDTYQHGSKTMVRLSPAASR